MHVLMHVYPYSLRVSDDNCLRHENDVMGGCTETKVHFSGGLLCTCPFISTHLRILHSFILGSELLSSQSVAYNVTADQGGGLLQWNHTQG